jgi:hypothetical protein
MARVDGPVGGSQVSQPGLTLRRRGDASQSSSKEIHCLTATDFVTVPIAIAMFLYPRLLLILTAGLRVGLRWPRERCA